jgi:hypothetical protein
MGQYIYQMPSCRLSNSREKGLLVSTDEHYFLSKRIKILELLAANSVVSNHNPSIASPGQDSCSAMASITPSPAAAISSSPKHDLTSSSLPSDSPTSLATSSSIEYQTQPTTLKMNNSSKMDELPLSSSNIQNSML